MVKIKLEADFTWNDRVKIITDREDAVEGRVTELKCSEDEIQYLVASGFEEKYCYAIELELVERPTKKNEKQDKGI